MLILPTLCELHPERAPGVYDPAVQSEQAEFIGASGTTLAATVRRPDSPVVGSVLMAHCFTCSKDLHTLTRLSKALAAEGWITFAFDFTGLGASAGDFGATSVSSNVGDLRRAAATMLDQRIGPCLLIGHSLGGSAAVLAAAALKTVDAVICIGSPADVDHVCHLLPDDAGEREDRFPVEIGGRTFDLDPGFVTDLATHDVRDAAAALNRPFLVVEAGDDEVVDHRQTKALATAGNGELHTIPGADHLFSTPDHARQLAEKVVDWTSRHASR
ncbi:MAG: pimeloyl-ACP methyl ester carboxylesterase [Candidatus Aldehydirespiratoraceae bacterium]